MDETVLEQHSFGAEVGRLLDLVVHSLYTEREIFLRELVANAADAVDRRRFEALTDSTLAPPIDAKIRIVPDKSGSTLLISDDGIGMTRQELIDNLGTIARSGTKAFLERVEAAQTGAEGAKLVGQFGIGFYSAFMVADRVDVFSRRAGSDEAWLWSSDGKGTFTVAPVPPEAAPARGTRVVLNLMAVERSPDRMRIRPGFFSRARIPQDRTDFRGRRHKIHGRIFPAERRNDWAGSITKCNTFLAGCCDGNQLRAFDGRGAGDADGDAGGWLQPARRCSLPWSQSVHH